jgi:hypothetical protein
VLELKKLEYTEDVIVSPIYGNCILRSFANNVEYEFFKRMNRAFPNRVPSVFEYYQFNALTPEEIQVRLIEMGYPESIRPVGGYFNGNLGLLEYVGVPLIDGILFNEDNHENVKKILLNFGNTLGELHSLGVICNDTHEKQFTVDEELNVWRIDAGNPYFYKERADKNVSLATIIDLAEFYENLIKSKEQFNSSVEIEKNFLHEIVQSVIQHFELDEGLIKDVMDTYSQAAIQ